MGNEESKVMKRIGEKKKHRPSRKIWNFSEKEEENVISIRNEKCEKTKGFLWTECTISVCMQRSLCTVKARLYFHAL